MQCLITALKCDPNFNVSIFLLSRVVYIMFVLNEIYKQQKQIGVSPT